MTLVAATETVGHPDFYLATTAVYSLIFITINIVFLSGSSIDDKYMRTKWVRRFMFFIPIILFHLTFGLAFPLVILAGFLQDTSGWRIMALIMVLTEILLGGIIATLILTSVEDSQEM